MRVLITGSSGQIGTNLALRLARVTLAPSLLGEVTHYVADISRARALLGWEPQVPLVEGIPRAVAWFLEHRSAHPEEDRPVSIEDAEIGWKAYAGRDAAP